MMCLGIATQPFFLSQAMVETFILEKSKSLRMEAACVMVLGIRSSLPKQQKQATLANVLSSDYPFWLWYLKKSGDTPANPMVYHHFPVKMIFWVFQFQFSEKTQLITSLKWQQRVWGLLVISVDYNSCTIGLNKLQRLLKEFWWLWRCRLQQFNALLLLLLFFTTAITCCHHGCH